MATKKKQKKKDSQQTKMDKDLDKINVFWTVLPGWNELPYKDKLSWYWRFEYNDKGERVFECPKNP